MKTDRRLHIAIVVNSIEPGGGVGNVALAQAKALSEYFSISLLCAHGSLDQLEQLNHDNIDLHIVSEPRVNWLRRFGHVVREHFLCRRFSRALSVLHKLKPLNFVLFHSHSSAAIAKPKLAQLLPCGMVIHGDIFSRPKGSYDALLTLYYKVCSKRAYQIMDLFIALSPSMAAKAIDYGADRARVVVIPNGVQVNNETRVIDSVEMRKHFKLLFVGRLSVEKAPLILLEAMTLVDASITLTIAGSGSLDLAIRRFIESHSLQDRVDLLGHIDSSQINDLYKNSDALCVPSINDPLPTVILEAMNAGVPVIGSDVDGIPSMIEHGVSGLLVEPNEPQALSQAITMLADSTQLRSDIISAAQQRINDEFSLPVVTKRLVQSISGTIKTFDEKQSSP